MTVEKYKHSSIFLSTYCQPDVKILAIFMNFFLKIWWVRTPKPTCLSNFIFKNRIYQFRKKFPIKNILLIRDETCYKHVSWISSITTVVLFVCVCVCVCVCEIDPSSFPHNPHTHNLILVIFCYLENKQWKCKKIQAILKKINWNRNISTLEFQTSR
jgi:hypothetical protein